MTISREEENYWKNAALDTETNKEKMYDPNMSKMDSDNEDLVDNYPDYVGTLKRFEKEVNKVTSGKLSKILSDVFDEELLTRQKQLEDVEEKIFKAQKLIHLVRYVLVTSYYKKKSLDITDSEENINTNFDSQNRIHPAIKKLLGGNSKLDIFTSGKRKNASRICDSSESPSKTLDIKKIKLDIKTAPPKKILDKNQNSLKSRRKTQHKIIIGNISKWIQLEENKTTYKWMMYVRGEKETPDISHIVEKVIFHLHHTYKPHDVVQVREPPFHLSRRGWGEFPLRVQIFFKCSLNKPINIVHNLKLDKSHTGRQTLGNETVVEVYLYDNYESPKPKTIIKPPEEPVNNSAIPIPIMNSPMEIDELNVDSKPLCNFDLNLAQFPCLESDFSQIKFNKFDNYESLKPETIIKPPEEPVNNSDITIPIMNSPMKIEELNVGSKPLCNFELNLSQFPNLESDFSQIKFNKFDNYESLKPETIIKPPEEPVNNSDITIPIMNSPMKIEELNVGSKPLCNFELNLSQFPNLESDFSQIKFNKFDSGFSESCTFNLSNSTLTKSHSHSAYEQSETASVSNEHDYCQDGDIMEEQVIDNATDTRHNRFMEYFDFEHSYCLSNKAKNVDHKSDQIRSETFPTGAQDQDANKLIFGLGDTYLKDEHRTTINASVQSSPNSSHSFNTMLTNGHSDTISIKSNESLMKSPTLTHFYESRYKVTLPQNKFKSIGEALPFLMKRLPLWNELARKEEYKTMYPFVATSHQEFKKWNIGKQLNSEWNRAKEVKKILRDRYPMATKWNTKAYFMYARTHAYHCCLQNVASFFKNKSAELTLIDNCFTESLPSKVYAGKKEESDIYIDIVSNGGASEQFPKKSSVDISDVTLRNHCSFIREAALDCGIVLKSEEIEDGVVMNGAERMILEAVKCLAEGLIRRSKHHSIRRADRFNCFSETSDITKYDVDKALQERTELQSIEAFQVKKREMRFFT